MTTKRAYKLQEFVAHTSAVNCLKIGRKSSRVLVTGGEDHKVNLWAIGKPNAILSLSGHSSGIDSVGFDSSEVLVAAGAASGTIKLWDLEEAKIVRTLTGHRSNCISVDFHPFGEFFASGSLDTNLKIWDIRRKGCIHTYKGHTRGVNAIRFTPDGRWVVSGGEDNTVKLWDLTAGKLLHEFKSHEGQVQCIDFHPHEFLLATGSSDKTVKFWDLETFELIGSAGPETSGVRCMAFNPDGRTLLCGLHESLKVFSWEPIRCHDTVDVGWSRLSDLNVHEGKLLGCSYNQSCVGVWVVDISRIEPYSVRTRSNGHSELKSASSGNLSLQNENPAKVGSGRLSTSHNSDLAEKETKPSGRHLANSNQPNKDSRVSPNPGGIPSTPQRVNMSTSPRNTLQPTAVVQKRNSSKTQSMPNASINSKPDVVPIIVPRDDARLEQAEFKREVFSRRIVPHPSQSKSSESRRFSSATEEFDGPTITAQPENTAVKAPEMGGVANKSMLLAARNLNTSQPVTERNLKEDRCVGSMKVESNSSSQPLTSSPLDNFEIRVSKTSKDAGSTERAGRTRSLVANWENREISPSSEDPTTTSSTSIASCVVDSRPIKMKSKPRGNSHSTEKDMPSVSSVTDDDIIAQIIGRHDHFLCSMQSRLGKLQAVRRFWDRNDVKGAIGAMEKMADHSVIADVVSLLTEKTDIVTLEICTCLLSLLASLLESDIDRHLGVSLDMLVKLVRVFGSVIYSAVSASSSVGVDIEAEQRLERCNLCYIELERVKLCLPALMRRGGSVAKSAQELNLALSAASE
ncbi:katanin p80 WD40 repeat-containing subunit B1 homolog [Chenopodium quinoa]|uniref:katanin p80 WD40 repeat-containing subunit B1 homolog n=1 Tax=Chenopodium quinoa TaxID=63459 RepID=UPI000B7938A3|nr:katanin p80 WD40 repeat-containing subunit B1 homolog [Chenopodium quinoa]XP_021736221.1 katanin p80 WD40 repeat-containing subunit B1 homolog [Chenopodium quinoa]